MILCDLNDPILPLWNITRAPKSLSRIVARVGKGEISNQHSGPKLPQTTQRIFASAGMFVAHPWPERAQNDVP
jgi:hypothetical protein